MQNSRPLSSSASSDAESASPGMAAARRVLVIIAAVAGVLGFVCVAAVVILGLTGRPVPSEFVGPFLALLPLAVVAIVASVILSAIQRRHN